MFDARPTRAQRGNAFEPHQAALAGFELSEEFHAAIFVFASRNPRPGEVLAAVTMGLPPVDIALVNQVALLVVNPPGPGHLAFDEVADVVTVPSHEVGLRLHVVRALAVGGAVGELALVLKHAVFVVQLPRPVPGAVDPVSVVLKHRLSDAPRFAVASLEAQLALVSITLAILIGMLAGIISGIRQNSIFDYASMAAATLGLALPTFIVGPMLVLLFAMKLDWFAVTWNRPDVWAALKSLGRTGVEALVERCCGHARAFADGFRRRGRRGSPSRSGRRCAS